MFRQRRLTLYLLSELGVATLVGIVVWTAILMMNDLFFIARQAIQYERRIECDSPEGRLICDEIVETGEMDAAIARVVQGLTSSGVVSAAGNRRAFRVTQEPLDMFRSYFAVYAREQAYCHFSPALISNLERYWNALSRKP